MRVLAIDYGDARTGIAVSDLTGSIVGRTEVIHSRNAQKTAEAIRALAAETGAQALVMGFPRNMDGTEGQQAIDTRAFGDALRERVGLPIRYVDERLTSMSAHSMLHEGGLKRKDHKKVVDKVAAVLILQTYMQNPARSQE